MKRNVVKSKTVRRPVLSKRFHAALERWRIENGLKRGPAADRLGIPRTTYFSLISPIANPCLQTVEHIARSMGVDPLSLLADDGVVRKAAPDAPASIRRV